MPTELNRIRELSGLQQEAPAKKKLKYSSSQYAQALSQLQLRNHKGELHTITPKQQQKIIDIIEQHGFGVELQNYLHKINVINKYAAVSEAPAAGDQALAKDLANHFMNKANEFKKSGDTGPEYEEMVDIAKAFQQGQDQGMEEINDLANFEFSAHPFGGKFSNNEGEPEDEVLAILNKHGYSFTEKSHPERPNRGLVTLIKKDAKESTVQEAPGAEINNSTMPTELNRIKELAGLQQEAAVISPNQIEAFKKWYATYSKMQSKDVYNYAKGIFKAHMETGVTELDGASKQDPRGKAYDDLAKIFPDMDGDIEAIGHQLKSQGVDPLDMEAQEESAVAEAPAGLTAPQKQGLAALVKKYAKRKTYGGGGLIDGYLDYLAQTGVWTDAADEKEFDVALKKLGHDDLDAWEQDAEGEEFEQFLKLAPITAQAQNDVEKVLGKGFYNNTNLINAASDYVKSLPESAVQTTPVLNAVKETPAISQVDEAIKKATAQLKSFSNFDGLKPYKPKKK